jgi:hypothetical protein
VSVISVLTIEGIVAQIIDRLSAMSTSVAKIVGVERNAASRFVDFSCSTEWEKSVLKIENMIRTLVLRGKDNDCDSLVLQGIKLKISFHCDLTCKPSYFCSLFDVKNRYILISRAGNDWLDCTTSQKHTLFSVLVTALQSCSDSLNDDSKVPPIFLTMVKEEDIQSSRTLDIMGYQIFKRLNGSIVVNYSSHSQNFNLLDAKDEFRYVDSLSKLFEKHMALQQRSTDYPKFASDVVVQVTLESSIKLATAPESSLSSILEVGMFPLVLEQIVRINEFYLPLNGRKRSIQGAHDITLHATLEYPPMKLTSIVDNENYSTLVPSKQSYHCWSARSQFNSKGWDTILSAVSFSSSLRRLLALFIYRKSDGSGSNLGPGSASATADGVGSGCNATERSISMAAVLSSKTIQALCSMCLNNNTDNKNEQEEEAYIQRILDLALLGNLSASEKNKRANKGTTISSPSFISEETLQLVETCAMSNIEILSLYAVCAGSLQCFSSSNTLWSRYLLSLRAHWDDGASLPGVNGPVRGQGRGKSSSTSSSSGNHSDSASKHRSIKHVKDAHQGERALDFTPLCDQLLWADVVRRKESLCSFDPVAVVDRSQPILAQKLKALQFCIAVKNEKILIEHSSGNILLQRRLPLTDDSVSQREYILEKLRPLEINDEIPLLIVASENLYNSIGDKVEGEGEGEVVDADTADVREVCVTATDARSSANAETIMSAGHLITPQVTKENENKSHDNDSSGIDGNLGSLKYNNKSEKESKSEDKDEEEEKESVTDSDEFEDTRSEEVSSALLQYWRVQMDVVISDMRAWKACKCVGNDVSMGRFQEFLDWYCGQMGSASGSEGGVKDSIAASSRVLPVVMPVEGAPKGPETVPLRSRKSSTLLPIRKKEEEKKESTALDAGDGDHVPVDSMPVSSVGQDNNGRNLFEDRVQGSTQGPVPLTPSEKAIYGILWRNCTPPCSAGEQKAMFSAETEAEKVLGYLGALAPEQLASELILSAMAACPPCLMSQIEGHVAAVTALVQRLSPSADTNCVGRILGQEKELKELCLAVSSAGSEMTLDTSQYEERRKETTVSQTALLCVDKVAELTERIEEYSARVTSLSRTLDQALRTLDKDVLSVFASVLPAMIHSMCAAEEGTFTPCNAKEVRGLMGQCHACRRVRVCVSVYSLMSVRLSM